MTWPPLGWAPAPGSSSQALITPFACPLREAAAPALPLRLLLGADVFDVRLDRFLAMSSLPFLNRRRDTHRRGELAMMAASRLSLVQWRYRGELVHVSSTIRRGAYSLPLRTLRRCLVIRASRRCSANAR